MDILPPPALHAPVPHPTSYLNVCRERYSSAISHTRHIMFGPEWYSVPYTRIKIMKGIRRGDMRYDIFPFLTSKIISANEARKPQHLVYAGASGLLDQQREGCVETGHPSPTTGLMQLALSSKALRTPCTRCFRAMNENTQLVVSVTTKWRDLDRGSGC